MCRKREEVALVASLSELDGKPIPEMRQFLAKSGRIVRKAYRHGIYPRPQHLVEDLCVTFVTSGRPKDPVVLATNTLKFIGKGFVPTISL